MSNNPAKRLHYILSEAVNTGQNEAKTKDVFKKIISPDAQEVEFLNRYSKIVTLPYEIRLEILSSKHADIVDDLMFWQRGVVSFFTTLNLSAAWSTAKNVLNKDLLSGIMQTSVLIDREFGYVDINRIEQIRIDAEKLLDDVRGSDLKNPVRKYILKHLLKIISALDNMEIGGLVEAEQVVQQIAGDMNFHNVVVNNIEIHKEDKNNNFAVAFMAIIASLLTVVSLMNEVAELPKSFSTVFPLESADQDTRPELSNDLLVTSTKKPINKNEDDDTP